jgi:mannitol-1-phosphate/altronate dehydrogenase
MDRKELEAYADDVILRFRNPAIHHRLASIALNSWSKFAARVMPQLLRYIDVNAGRMPRRLVLALAATMVLYRGGVIELPTTRPTWTGSPRPGPRSAPANGRWPSWHPAGWPTARCGAGT